MSEAKSANESPEAGDHDAEFHTMMEALEVYFHVTSCQNHTPEERREAYLQARTAFVAFAFDEDATDAEVIAEPPGREEVLGANDPSFDASGPKPGDKVH